MQNTVEQVWNACGYVRLSREDGDKEESNGVTGQMEKPSQLKASLRHYSRFIYRFLLDRA